MMNRLVPLALTTVAVTLAGCYVENESAPPPATTEAAPAPTSSAPNYTSSGGGSALGPARRAAHGTVDAAAARNRELERQLEEE